MCERQAEEIEVTPEMIEAGVRVLYESGAIENPIYSNDQSLVCRIFLSMSEARQSSRLLVPKHSP